MKTYRPGSVLIGLILGTAGGAIADVAGFPAGWMIGASTAIAFGRLAGARTTLPVTMRDVAFAGIGLSIGARMSADTFVTAASWWPSFLGVVLSTAGIMVLAALLIKWVSALDPHSARLAAIPGTVAQVVSIALDGGARTSDIMLVQSLRLLVLTLALPLLLDVSAGSSGMAAPSMDGPRQLRYSPLPCLWHSRSTASG